MQRIELTDPYDFLGLIKPPIPRPGVELYYLAQGDSWFSLGHVPPWETENLLVNIQAPRSALAVNCARPGAELTQMVNVVRNPLFGRLLLGNGERKWSAILISGLGNDVIAAVMSSPKSPPHKRILAVKTEWSRGSGIKRYISEAGWKTFETYARAIVDELLSMRARSRYNSSTPIVMHTYDLATPRNSSALLSGPWLYKAVRAFGVPEADWKELSVELLGRVRALLESVVKNVPDIHLVQTQGTLEPARTADKGETKDWKNEIHPSTVGYGKLAALWTQKLLDLSS